MKNSNLAAAKVAKNDEFYTELSEIQAERISEKTGITRCGIMVSSSKAGGPMHRTKMRPQPAFALFEIHGKGTCLAVGGGAGALFIFIVDHIP